MPGDLGEAGGGRPDRENERPLTVWVSKAMHREVKRAALELDMTVKNLVSEAVTEKLQKLRQPS